MRRTGSSFSFVGTHILIGVENGLIQAANQVMEESQVQVPVDTGTLKSSASVEEPVHTADAISVTLGYAIGDKASLVNPKSGKTVDQYATEVHELTDVFHAEPTKAKFLEDPANEFETALGPVLQEAINGSQFAKATGFVADA